MSARFGTRSGDDVDHVAFMLEPIAGSVEIELPQLGFQAVKHLDPRHDA